MLIARTLVLGSCLLAAAVAVAPRPATACGMYRMPIMRMKPASADDLLAQARRKIDQADWTAASRLVSAVAESTGPRSEQRAQALAIMGWSAWQAGARARALAYFRRARALDTKGAAVDGVLAQVKTPVELQALRAALEA
jgi:hypothetical protein